MANKPGVIVIEGHVQGLSNTRSLGEAGIPVYVLDKTNCLARHSRYCQKFLICPDYQSDAFADFLMEIGLKERLKDWLLLPSNDHAVNTISKHKVRLEAIYKVTTPSRLIIERIYSKQKLLEAAEIAGVPFPVSWFPEAIEESVPQNLGFPALVKGKFGLNFYRAIGKKAFIVGNVDDMVSLLHKLSKKLPITEIFIQELIPLTGLNKTLSFCAFCENGEVKTVWMGRKLREHPIEFGTATFAESVYVAEIVAPAINLLRELNYNGPCEVEFIQDPRDGTYKLIEINARTWLWVGLAKACGVDFAMITYNYANGIEQSHIVQYKTGIRWRNLFTDIPFTILARLKRKNTSLQKSKEKVIDALWMRSDSCPYFMYPVLLLRFFKNR